jgi:hypothetical protein
MPLPTGPTAWLAPAFPGLLALVFRVFGVYTLAAAVAILTINCLFSALTGPALYWAVRPVFGPALALASALGLALLPTSLWHAIQTIWDTSLLALVLVLLLGLLVRLGQRDSFRLVLLCAAAMGAVLWVNSAPGVTFPFIAGWYYWRRRGAPGALRNAFTLAVVPAVLLSPWVLRNYFAVGVLGPRCCLGVELNLGNNIVSWQKKLASHAYWLHPGGAPEELRLFRTLGEKGYDALCGQKARRFILENPGKFADLLRWRVQAWWLGYSSDLLGPLKTRLSWSNKLSLPATAALTVFFVLGAAIALKRRRPSGLLLVFSLSYPLPYYVIHVSYRYRYPMEPILLAFALYGAWWLVRRWLPARVRDFVDASEPPPPGDVQPHRV